MLGIFFTLIYWKEWNACTAARLRMRQREGERAREAKKECLQYAARRGRGERKTRTIVYPLF
jgi:hypothetical protein